MYSMTVRSAMDDTFSTTIAAFLILGMGLYIYYLFDFQSSASYLIVEEAHYGENCALVEAAPPGVNYYHPGNATRFARDSCLQRLTCRIPIKVSVLGDPVSGCAKDFKVEYRCGLRGPLLTAEVTAEANGQLLDLSCSR
jgi:hypothetical protein